MILKSVKDLTQEQIRWYRNHIEYDPDGFDFIRFEDDDEKDIERVKNLNIYFKNRQDIEFFPFKFKDCRGFRCYNLTNLLSLEGSPDRVFRFCMWGDKSLESFDGISKVIENDLDIDYCSSLKSIDFLKNVDIQGKIDYDSDVYLEGLSKNSKELLNDMKLFRKWQKSDLTVDEFMKEWNGYFEAKKYGI